MAYLGDKKILTTVLVEGGGGGGTTVTVGGVAQSTWEADSKLSLPTPADLANGGTNRLAGVQTNGTAQVWFRTNPLYIYPTTHNTQNTVIPAYKQVGTAFANKETGSTEALDVLKNTIFVAEPILDYEAANKKWEEDKIKVYKHFVSVSLLNDTGIAFTMEVLKSGTTLITSSTELSNGLYMLQQGDYVKIADGSLIYWLDGGNDSGNILISSVDVNSDTVVEL